MVQVAWGCNELYCQTLLLTGPAINILLTNIYILLVCNDSRSISARLLPGLKTDNHLIQKAFMRNRPICIQFASSKSH